MPDSQPPLPILLASGSRYRAELLGRLGLSFDSRAPDIDETPRPGEPAHDLAERLARSKALALAAHQPATLVIGSDQVAECSGRLLGKPGGREAAIEHLTFCAGRKVTFHTAVAMCREGRTVIASVPTQVQMRELTPERIERYVDLEQPFDCAGAMKSEALGISLCERISSDDPTALIGLPLTKVVALLAEFGVEVP